ncbi:PREDICTED: THAP domain-containing protein 4-like [Cyphomyrmex costatus]|uniref:THAP domain-containing protein 4-like n=1 Tax=Cyphomyrmex costatus TaxID=456900 RepID=UPI00085228A9|nr:PREDICTED: THAP domain-containing protein 4-like [Cyphomyrmex costatus]
MPGCCVPNCTNSAAKGFLMKHFPRNPERRIQWTINIPRANWTPTDSSCICEVHFSSEMWEKPRCDGKRILKYHAVPTIFKSCFKTVVASRQNTESIQSAQTVKMDKNSNLTSNNIIVQHQEEPIKSLIVPKHEKMYDVLRKYIELNNILTKRLNIEQQNQCKQGVNTNLSSFTKVFINNQTEALTKESRPDSKYSKKTFKKAI